MNIKHIDEIEKKTLEIHGETTLYQLIFGRGTEEPDLMKSIRSLWRMTIEPGGINRPHSHRDEEQIYIIIDGGGTIQVGDEKAKVKKGDAIYLPPQVSHAFYNDTKKPCVILAVGAVVVTPELK